MKELSTDAQHLVDLTRRIDGPNPSRRDAVRVGLHAALAATTASAGVNAALAATTASAGVNAALAATTASAGVNAALAPAAHAGSAMAVTGPIAAAVNSVKGTLLGGGVVSGILSGFGIGTIVFTTMYFTTPPRSEPTPSANSATSNVIPAGNHRDESPSSVSRTPIRLPLAPVTAAAVNPERVATNQRPLPPTEAVVAPVDAAAGPTEARTATLADETRLLAQTQLAIRSSDPERALALLDEYEHRFASGSLREEARAARVLALCKAGRQEQGRAAAALFEQQFPKSPLVPRVRRSCDLMR
jgi:hypothetical protein